MDMVDWMDGDPRIWNELEPFEALKWHAACFMLAWVEWTGIPESFRYKLVACVDLLTEGCWVEMSWVFCRTFWVAGSMACSFRHWVEWVPPSESGVRGGEGFFLWCTGSVRFWQAVVRSNAAMRYRSCVNKTWGYHKLPQLPEGHFRF